MAALFFTLSLIAARMGIDPKTIERYAGDVYATRPRKYKPPTQEEIEAREDEEVRRAFAASLARIKAEIKKKNESAQKSPKTGQNCAIDGGTI